MRLPPARPRPARVALPLLGLCLLASLGRADDAAPPGPPIERIEIRRQDVFSPEEAAIAFFPYGLANAIHVTTHEAFVRKELLFSVGDPVDPAVLAETERRLRSFRLFRRVSIVPDGATVVVETGDTWTLLPRLAFSNKGGVITYQFGIEEYNLLGTGRQLGFRFDKDTQRISRSLTFVDPQFFHRYTALRFLASDLSDGKVLELGVGRPFYALAASYSFDAFYRQALYDTKLYEGGDVATVWKQRDRIATLGGGRLLRSDEVRADRVIASIEWTDTALMPGGIGAPPPADPRRFLFLSAGLEREARGWIVRQNVEQIGRDEDVNLAPSGRFDVGVSPAGVGGSLAAGRLRLSGTAGTLVGSGFSTSALVFETRYQDGFRNTLLGVQTRLYLQRGASTLVARLGLKAGWRLDPEDQFQLDGENGVRGYRLHAVAGTGNLVGNLELRTLVFPEVLRLVSLGFAVFGDAGTSWGPPDGTWRLADAGVGLRIGLSRASKNTLLRADVARAFRPDPLGRTGWLFSFSSGQAF